MTLDATDWMRRGDDEEQGICLDNDSPATRMLDSDEGIPITGFNGQPTLLTHDQQKQLRSTINSIGCHHPKSQWTIDIGGTTTTAIATHRCADCHVVVAIGHVVSWTEQFDARGGLDINLQITCV